MAGSSGEAAASRTTPSVLKTIAAALARLVERLRSATPSVRPTEIERALEEDAGGGSDDGASARAGAAAEAAKRAKRERS